MLGRTANGLYWMFRYLERAENTARMLEAGLRMALTRDHSKAEEEWRSVIATSGQLQLFEAHYPAFTGPEVWNFLLRAPENPGNVLRTFEAVRTNARMVRNAITTEMWEAINEGWMLLRDQLARPVGQGSLGQVVGDLRRSAMRVHGAVAGSMLRDAGYHFARAGSLVERSDCVARILDIKYYLLLPSLSYVGSSLDKGQWDNVLRSVSGDRAYRWLNAGEINARGIVEFMVLDQRFPRSLAFCHAALREELGALGRTLGRDGDSNRLMREADQRMNHLTIDAIFDMGLHEFVLDFIGRNAAIDAAIARDYRFTA